VPLVCFEWHQRPENVVAGRLTWGDYKRSDRPNWVRIEHHKTGEQVDMRCPIDMAHSSPNLWHISTALSGWASPSC
jgi:hypothetical protein